MKDKRKKSDFTQIKDSGSCCVGCGRSSQIVLLMRLRTYSRSLCCGACFIKYAKCENINPVGTKCHHEPTDHLFKTMACSVAGCGCPRWVHGLESDFDRQLAEAVGKSPTTSECSGFGINVGKCGRPVFLGADGSLSRLCAECERSWVQQVTQGQKEIGTLLDLDVSKVEPN